MVQWHGLSLRRAGRYLRLLSDPQTLDLALSNVQQYSCGGNGAVFSIAATSLPAVAIGLSGSGTSAHRDFRRSQNSCANPADTELVPLSSSLC